MDLLDQASYKSDSDKVTKKVFQIFPFQESSSKIDLTPSKISLPFQVDVNV